MLPEELYDVLEAQTLGVLQGGAAFDVEQPGAGLKVRPPRARAQIC